jgi:hypothetical protein
MSSSIACQATHSIHSNRGLHNQSTTVRSRVFYLFHRFIKDTKSDIPVDVAIKLFDGIRDLLLIQVEIPDVEATDQPDLLTEAVNNPGLFDSQLYLFETAGLLVSLLCKAREQQAPLLLSVVKPLLDALSTSLLAVTKDPREILPILEVHHIIMALGNIAKGFPDYPSPPTEGYVLPPLEIFGQVAQAILVCLEAMNVFKIVRDAVCFVLLCWPRAYVLVDTICLRPYPGDNWPKCHALHPTVNDEPLSSLRAFGTGRFHEFYRSSDAQAPSQSDIIGIGFHSDSGYKPEGHV